MRPAVRLAFAAAALVLTGPGAKAGMAGGPQDACMSDAMRFCRDATNVAGTTACLVAHRARLGSTCRGVFAFAEPVADRKPVRAVYAMHRQVAHAYRVIPHHRLARRAPYHIPRFDQAEAEAEMHAQYGYRTPCLTYWLFT